MISRTPSLNLLSRISLNETTRPSFSSTVVRQVPRDSVHFGSSETHVDDAAAIAILDSVLAQLDKVQNWKLQDIQDKHGNLPLGGELSFSLDRKAYGFRSVSTTSDKDLPANVIGGNSFIEYDTTGGIKKTHALKSPGIFKQYWPALLKKGNPVMAARLLDQVLKNADKLTEPRLFSISSGNLLKIKIDGHKHRLEWNQAEGKYSLSEETPATPEQIKQYWETTTALFTENNATRPANDQRKIDSLEEFTQNYHEHWVRSSSYPLTQEQFTTLYNAIKDEINAQFNEKYGLGPDFNPRPVLRKVAIDLLKNTGADKAGKTSYTDRKYQEEAVFSPNRGVESPDKKVNLTFDIAKAPDIMNKVKINYRLTIREGDKCQMDLALDTPQDIAVADKIIKLAKAQSERHSKLDSIKYRKEIAAAMNRPLKSNQEYLDSLQIQVQNRLEELAAQELTDVLPVVADDAND